MAESEDEKKATETAVGRKKVAKKKVIRKKAVKKKATKKKISKKVIGGSTTGTAEPRQQQPEGKPVPETRQQSIADAPGTTATAVGESDIKPAVVPKKTADDNSGQKMGSDSEHHASDKPQEPIVSSAEASRPATASSGAARKQDSYSRLQGAGFLYTVLYLILILGGVLLYMMVTRLPHSNAVAGQRPATSQKVIIQKSRQSPTKPSVSDKAKPESAKPLPGDQMKEILRTLGASTDG